MKKPTFVLLLLFSCLNVWASDFYKEYKTSETDSSTGLTVEFKGDIATVTLYKSDALAYNIDWPGSVRSLGWSNIKLINFVSEDGAVYTSNDWIAVKGILNPQYSQAGDLSLDFSAMIINDSEFKIGASNANYIKMPNGLKDLVADAFKDSYYLSAIGWSPNLETIGQEAFFETAFETITVPEGVTSIGPHAFQGCPNLTTITLPASLEEVGAGLLEGTHVSAIHSHNLTAPDAKGDICDNTGWDRQKGEFSFYGDCILYIHPDLETFESYLNSPIWCKFFISGSARICLHTYDLNRPLVVGVQELTVNQENVHSEIGQIIGDFERTFHVNSIYFKDMTKIKWYTIMLPFDVDENIVKNVFGDDTQVMGYSGIHDNTLCFEEAKDVIKANVPYLIKPGDTKSEYEFDGTTISYSEILGPTEISALGANTSYNQYDSEFVGTYRNKQIPVYAYYLKNDLFYYMPKENTQKGWKAYSGVVIINSGATADGSVAARPSATYLDINLDADMPTGIDSPTSVAIGSQSLDGPIYTLSGQQVKNPGKGIYIRNGKKFIIK